MAQSASPADITAVSKILKEVYVSDNIVSQLNDDTMLLSEIEKTTEYADSVGSKAVGFVKNGRNVGTSARSLTGGTLGAAGHQQENRWELDYKANYVQIKILGGTIAKMSTARQAAVRAITNEVEGAILDLKKELQRQLYGTGDALIAQFGANTTTATLSFNAPLAANDAIVRGWLTEGMYVDIGTTASQNAVVGDAKITAVAQSDTTPTITIDSSVTTTTSHYVSKAGNRSGTTSYELNGLGNLVNTGNVFAAIDPANDRTWQAADVNDLGGSTALSRAAMQRAWRAVRQQGKAPNRIITSLEHQEDYYNLLQSQVRFAGDTNLASGKVDGPTFNQVPVTADPDCPRQVMYFLNTKDLFYVSEGDIAWQNVNTGGDVLAWSQGEDAFVAMARCYWNLGTERRRSHAKIKGIKVN